MKLKLFFSLIFLNTFLIKAIEIPFNNFYQLNSQLYNPAFAGREGKTSISALGNYQYTGFEDRTVYFGSNSYLSRPKYACFQLGATSQFKLIDKNNLGIGFTNLYFTNVLININHFKMSANWQYKIQDKFISFGLGLSNYQNKLKIEGYKKTFFNQPNFINGSDKNISNFNYDLGVAFNNPKNNFFVGFSILDIHKNNDLAFGNPEIYVESNPYPKYVLNTGIDINLNSKMKFKPSVLALRETINYLLLTTNFEYQNKYLFGTGYTTNNDGVFLNLGYKHKKLELNYAYSLVLSRILSVTSDNHNIGIRYQL